MVMLEEEAEEAVVGVAAAAAAGLVTMRTCRAIIKALLTAASS
tara:strand:+ start:421 stop:549 length:129 start_codon:yes stop_codon:yes gene_type:complete